MMESSLAVLMRRPPGGEPAAPWTGWVIASDVAHPVWLVATHSGELTARRLVITSVPTTGTGQLAAFIQQRIRHVDRRQRATTLPSRAQHAAERRVVVYNLGKVGAPLPGRSSAGCRF
jgi:hypothetical protein